VGLLGVLRPVLDDLDALPARQAAALRSAFAYLSADRIPAQELGSVEEMVRKLENGEVDAAVYDAPVLAYYAKASNGGRISLVGPPFTREYYGIALPLKSDLTPAINIALLNTYSDGS
jgi:polar amino acid transport system substrate-binding protein